MRVVQRYVGVYYSPDDLPGSYKIFVQNYTFCIPSYSNNKKPILIIV